MDCAELSDQKNGLEIAIIGMVCRSPGARNMDEFWQNLRSGIESISFFSDEELESSGVDRSLLHNPNYVKARGMLEDIDLFDASFFRVLPREAEIMDPQHRIFLECAWEALENAGYATERNIDAVGVFAGTSMNSYLLTNLSAIKEVADDFQTMLADDKDFIATRVSYKLNLQGPSFMVQTACSTSLVAVHLACQSLLNGECDLALAGGISVTAPQKGGYIYREGGILSPDGHCRAFDAQAQGTVIGNGVGIVVLKRLEDALADGDSIHAIIKGSAINNDGALKVGYTAPSVDGQARVIRAAYTMAECDARTISYVEAHGTGTPLGDPIEIASLTQAFRASTQENGFCAIGSVKTNIGHLDAAAGIAGLIKTVLMLKHKELPPSLHFKQPNPQIDFANSPFYVNTTLTPWKANGSPRRAGVSSFGIGGTNAHVLLEEAPLVETSGKSRPWHLLVLSAKTSSALNTTIVNVVKHLKQHPDIDVADIAYTSQVGRSAFNYRKMLVCRDIEDVITALEAQAPEQNFMYVQEALSRAIVFMFPGQGAQYVNMGRELYHVEPIFRQQIEICSELLRPHLGLDLCGILYPPEDQVEDAGRQLNKTWLTQPALFVIEYALARLWMEWGIVPQAMIGHSIGEYVAACLAGVFSLEEVLTLVAVRGRFVQNLPNGAMLTVPLPEQEVQQFLNTQLSLAAINAPSLCVVSGTQEAVDTLRNELAHRGINCRYLQTSHAFHSAMMDPALAPFTEQVKQASLKPPAIPYMSNVTGNWIRAEEATDPNYWTQHLRQTVRFSEGMHRLLQDMDVTLLEVGPGQVLSALAREQFDQTKVEPIVLASLRRPQTQYSDEEFLLHTLGSLWLTGVQVDWKAFHAHERCRRIPLPTYPFERQRHWIEPSRKLESEATHNNDMRDNFCDLTSLSILRKDTPMGNKQPNTAKIEAEVITRTSSMRQDIILSKLKGIFKTVSGIDSTNIDINVPFLELDFDSLVLLQFNQQIRDSFGIKISFRRLFDECPTLASLTDYLDRTLPPEEQHHEEVPAPVTDELLPISNTHPSPAMLPGTSSEGDPLTLAPNVSLPTSNAQPSPTALSSTSSHNQALQRELQSSGRSSVLEQIIGQQIQLMSQQLDLLRNNVSNEKIGFSSEDALSQSLSRGHQPVTPSNNTPQRQEDTDTRARSTGAKVDMSRIDHKPYTPSQPIQPGGGGGLSTRQQKHLNALVERYTKRTRESKRLAQAYRPVLADPIAVAGFRLLLKEMTYPIFAERSVGSKIWDVDGNEYVDVAMGFGVHLFGHAPSFITRALEKQIQEGIQIGPQAKLVGKVAELVCELTGMERAMFCNSGTDAVMVAIRLARTATARNKIVMFTGSYHGSFDGVLAKMRIVDGEPRTAPAAPGIPEKMVEDVLVLPYDNPTSLEIIEAHASELAAVLVEPVQSRRPDLQPREFLHELRRLTEQHGIPLIFDEVITGFRIHLGGAQAWFGVQADLATFSKVVGGGMPFSVVAGKSAYMDALDGGMWNFGDSSYPPAQVTQFGGAFFKHPLSLAAAWTVLNHLKTQGPGLQQRLNQRADQLADNLNAFFEQEQVPIQMVHFGSLFSFAFQRELQSSDIFYYHLAEKGVYTWKGRTCFLSTAHTDEDTAWIIQAVKQSVIEMKEGGFLQPSSPDAPETPPSSPPNRDEALSVPVEVSSTGANNAAFVLPSEQDGMDKLIGERRIPLPEEQKQAWVAVQMEGDAPRAYNESLTLHMRGPFCLTAMRQALQRVVDRHEALRVTFSPQGDYQRISATMTIEVPLLDFSQLSHSEREVRVQEWIADNTSQPFDLVQGPLLSARILKLEEEYHLLVLTLHHIIIDTWSYGVLLKELSLFYSATCQGIICNLPPPMQLSDYVQWQANQEQSAETAATEEYWLEQFATPAPPLELSTDRPRLPVKTYHGSRQLMDISPQVYSDVKRLSKQQGCTLFMALLAGFNALLYQLTGQNDLVVGIPSAGQVAVGGKDLVGFYISVLPLRSRILGDPTFEQYLASVKKITLDAYDHSQYTLGKLVQKLRMRRDPGRSPLTTVMFNLERVEPVKFFDLEVETVINPTVSARHDISITLVEIDTKLILLCNYNTDLFTDLTIRHWMEHFEALLSIVAASPTIKLSELKRILTEVDRQKQLTAREELEKAELPGHRSDVEQQQIFSKFSNTQFSFPDETCLHHLFEAQVERNPEGIAVACGQERLSYLELNRRANKIAHRLQSLGVGPDVLVGICVERSLEMVVGLLGILKAGGAYLPLDPAYPQERLAFMLEDAQVSILLTTRQLETVLAVRSGVRVEYIDTDMEFIAQENDTNPVSEVTAQHLAYLIYTSGSTGVPKGVAVQHHSLVNYTHFIWQLLHLGEGLHLATVSTITADLGNTTIFPSLVSGSCLHVLTYETATSGVQFAEYIAAHPIDVLKIVPSHLRALLGSAEGRAILPRKYLLLGGEALSTELAEQLLTYSGECEVLNHYGPTETTVGVLIYPVKEREDHQWQSRTVPIGRPIVNTEAYILDDQLQSVPSHVPGELYIGGAGLARCYLNRPDLTAEAFIPNPFSDKPGERLYKTGDLAQYLADGNIEFLGRRDHQVKVHGYRIELGEIETVLGRHPAVRENVVIAREDSPGVTYLVAYVVTNKQTTVPQATLGSELRSYMQSKLPDYMVPSVFMLLEALPLTANGKSDRYALPAPDQDQLKVGRDFVAPRTPVEKTLADIWSQLLELKQVGIHDNFFDLGGHSLIAIQAKFQINSILGVDLPLPRFFDSPTISELAQTVETAMKMSGATPETQTIMPISRETQRRKLSSR